jgi:hypothetical protein
VKSASRSGSQTPFTSQDFSNGRWESPLGDIVPDKTSCKRQWGQEILTTCLSSSRIPCPFEKGSSSALPSLAIRVRRSGGGVVRIRRRLG